MAAGLHISINAEKVFEVSGVPISNSIITTWLVLALIAYLAVSSFRVFTKTKFDKKPGRFQSLMELIVESLYGLVKSIAGSDKKARIFFPLISTFFIFILLSNWSGLIPGVGSIGFREKAEEHVVAVQENSTETKEPLKAQDSADHQATPVVDSETHAVPAVIDSHETPAADLEKSAEPTSHSGEEEAVGHGAFVPYFRGPTADLNTTLALAVFAMVSVQLAGFKFLGFPYVGKFLNFKGPIDFFVGILELSSEFSKIISFAFRLFGNIFAGEVLLTVIAFLLPLFGPIPFLGLEIFVGLVQALVFSMLCLVFMNLATIGHSENH